MTPSWDYGQNKFGLLSLTENRFEYEMRKKIEKIFIIINK